MGENERTRGSEKCQGIKSQNNLRERGRRTKKNDGQKLERNVCMVKVEVNSITGYVDESKKLSAAKTREPGRRERYG